MNVESQPRIFSRAVRYIRKRLGLSRQQFAMRLGVTLDCLAEIENREGIDLPSEHNIARAIKREFGLDAHMVANVYVTDASKMRAPFGDLLEKVRPHWRDACEAAFSVHIPKQ